MTDWTQTRELRLRASVLAHFELPWLGPLPEPAPVDALLQDCYRTAGADGVGHWVMPDSARREILMEAGLDRARQAWQALTTRPDTAEQQVIDQCLGHGAQISLDGASAQRTQAVASVARWLNVLGVPLPSEWELSTTTARAAILSPMRRLADRHFTGRAALLARLANDLRYTPAITLIHGIGGIGKSTIAARHLLSAADSGTLVSYVTFDHGSIDPAQPASIVAAMCRQLTAQLDERASEQVSRLIDAAVDSQRRGSFAGESAGRSLGYRGQSDGLLPELVSAVGGRRYLLVIDAVEEAQRRGLSAVLSLLSFAGQVRRILAPAQVLLLGRAALTASVERELTQIRLEGLEFAEAVGLLGGLIAELDEPPAGVDLPAAIGQVGTSPLCVRLAAGVLARAPQDEALRDLALTRGAIEGELYRRLLGHVDNPEVRKLAHPGLTLRRVTPDLIWRVLAGPCGVDVPDNQAARWLFEKLAAEAMLVDQVPGADEVVHRADIRALMLGRLSEDALEVAAQIHHAAVRYYRERDLPAERAEEIYHRLMLGQPADELDRRWRDDAVASLLPSMDELPAVSKVYLAQRAGVLDVSDRDLITAQLSTQRDVVMTRVQRLVAAGQAGEALAELQRHQDQTSDSSPEIASLWVEVLELHGDLDQALERAEAERRRAAQRGTTVEVFTFTLHAARLLERTGRPGAAAGYLDEALRLVRELPASERYALMRLRLIAARLGLSRRAGLPVGPGLSQEAEDLAGETSPRALAGVRGLLRDLAAEVGTPGVLRTALSEVGLQAQPESLALTLEAWDSIESQAQGAPAGALARLARVSADEAGQPDWEAWLSGQGRGRLGEELGKLSLAADTFPAVVAVDLAAFYQRESDIALVGFEAVTNYEFVGRDADIRWIEARMLGHEGGRLLVHGLAGAGKSSLLMRLAAQWQQTGVVDRVFRFSFEDRKWTVAEILGEIASILPDRDLKRAGPVQVTDQAIAALEATRHALILDDVDRAAPGPDLADLLEALRGGRTLVLLGARDPGAGDLLRLTLAQTYALPALDPQSAALLAEHILRRQGAPRYDSDDRERTSLEELITVLAGSPRAISLVLPALTAAPPAEVLAALATGGEAADRDGRIRAAMGDSIGRLTPPMRRALLLLAPFTGVISTGAVLDDYRQRLSQDSSVGDFAAGDLDAALDRATAAGLVTAHRQLDDFVLVQPLLPYVLRTALAQQPRLLALAQQAHYQVYSEVGPQLSYLLTAQDDPQKRATGRAVTEAEYFNLAAALRYGLGAGQPVVQLVQALDEYLDQAGRQAARHRLATEAIEAVTERDDEVSRRELAQLRGMAGNAARAGGDLAEAARQYEAELEMQQAAGDRRGMAISNYQLAQLASDRGQYERARDSYRRALDLFQELDEPRNAGAVYLGLGSVARGHGDPAEAEDYVRHALQVFLESGDRRAMGDCHYQLGLIAQDQWQLGQAEESYRRALEVWLEFDDSYRAAIVYTRLGFIAREQGRYDDADADTRRALDLHARMGNRYQLAESLGQLALIAQARGRPEEAEAGYRQALDIFLEFEDHHGAAVTLFSLGNLAAARERYEEAESSYRRAVELAAPLPDRRLVAEAHLQLGRLTEEQGRQAEAEVSYLAALEVSQELPDERAQSSIATNVGLALARLGQHDRAVPVLLRAATAWHRLTGEWAKVDLEGLRRERAHAGPARFAEFVAENVPAELAGGLTAALDAPASPA